MSEQTQELVHKYSENGITTLTLNQPEKKNSLSMAMLEALSEELAIIASDSETRVVVLAAHGNVFCAGHDSGKCVSSLIAMNSSWPCLTSAAR